MKSLKFHYLLVPIRTLVGIILLTGCSSNYGLLTNEYSNLYDRSNEFRPEVYVRQYHPDSAFVYVTFNTDELLYKRSSIDSPFKARLAVTAKLSDWMQTDLSDSLVQYFVDERKGEEIKERIYGRFSMPLKDTIPYKLNVSLTDLNAGKERDEYVFISSSSTDQRYMDIFIDDKPSRYCACGKTQRVTLKPYWNTGRLTATVVDRDWAPAALPFSVNFAKEPSQSEPSTLSFTASEGALAFDCPSRNTILLGTQDFGVWPVAVYRTDFPHLLTYNSLAEPLRYITTNDEYDKLRYAVDQRKAITEFWLNCASDPERSTNLMRAYYKRVEEANLYFSDVEGEGWMSDRGLVYTVYGPPSRVVMDGDREIWFFNSEQAEYGLQMYFTKGRRVRLDRSLDYKQSWYLTVDGWRNGKVSNL